MFEQKILRVDSVFVQKADTVHPYGYTNAKYVASLISGVGIFCIGAGLSFYHGIEGLFHPHTVENFFWVSLTILPVSTTTSSNFYCYRLGLCCAFFSCVLDRYRLTWFWACPWLQKEALSSWRSSRSTKGQKSAESLSPSTVSWQLPCVDHRL